MGINKSTIIRRLKVNVTEMVNLRHRADVLESTVFADTYLWATAAVSDGTARDIAHACEILADTLKTYRPDTVRAWYQSGKFMAENNLRADKADRRIVRDIASSQSKIRRSTMLKTVDMLKKGRPYSEIKSLLRKEAPFVDIAQKASRRITSLQAARDSLNNEQLLKLEMRVVEGLAKEVYGKVVYVTIEDKDGNVLATSDRKRARSTPANETVVERTARLKKERQWRQNRTPEQKEAKRQIDKKSRQTRQANETPDERKMRRQAPR